jgi:hypothetical protein
MSLLDSNIDIELTPKVVNSIWRIPIHTKVIQFDPFKSIESSRGYYHKCLVEVWYPNNVYKNRVLKENVVHVGFIRNPEESNWMTREDVYFSNLNFDDFSLVVSSIKDRKWENLDELHKIKPFKS